MQILTSPIAVGGCGRLEGAPMHFGQWLKDMRDVKGWNQRHLMLRSGLSSFTITKAESAESSKELSKTTVQKLAGAFDLEPEAFNKMWKEGRDIHGQFYAFYRKEGEPAATPAQKLQQLEEAADALGLEPDAIAAHFKKLAKEQATTRRIGATPIVSASAGATPLKQSKGK